MKRLKIEKTKTRWYGISITSGCDEWPGCKLILKLPNNFIMYRLPQWIKPYREQRESYVVIDARKYGIVLLGNYLSISYGRSTHDSDTDKRKTWVLPWSE